MVLLYCEVEVKVHCFSYGYPIDLAKNVCFHSKNESLRNILYWKGGVDTVFPVPPRSAKNPGCYMHFSRTHIRRLKNGRKEGRPAMDGGTQEP